MSDTNQSTSMTGHFLIWSNEHAAWWRPSKNGYTNNILEAGAYPETEARHIVGCANLHQEVNAVMILAQMHW